MKKIITILILTIAMAIAATATPGDITLLSPENGANVTSKTVTFLYQVNVTENNTNCTYTGPAGSYSEIFMNDTPIKQGQFQITFPNDNAQVTWTITCNDTGFLEKSSSFSIKVPPTMSTIASTTLKKNQNYQVTVTSDADVLTGGNITLSNAPAGMTIEKRILTQDWLINWTATAVMAPTTITATATDSSGLTATQAFTITVMTDSKLRINNVNIKTSGNDNDVKNFGTIDDADAIMGEALAIYVDVCNDQASGEDVRNVEAEITIYDIDGGDDIDGTISRFTLDGTECEEKKVSLDINNIPFTADYKQYRVFIDVEGRNESNSATMRDSWNVYFTVNKDDDPNIKITEAIPFPTTISCDRNFNLDVSGVNIGENDDDAVLKIESQTLKIYSLTEFEIGDDPDDDCNAIDEPDQGCFMFENSFNYKVDANLAPGTYPITLTTYWETSKQSDRKTVNLVVERCAPVTTTPTTTPTTPTTTTPTTPTTTTPIVEVRETAPVSAPTTTPIRIVEKSSFADSQAYTVLLILANVGLFALIIAVLKQAFTRKP